MASTISRITWTDDSGDFISGSAINNAFLTSLQDNIDALFSALGTSLGWSATTNGAQRGGIRNTNSGAAAAAEWWAGNNSSQTILGLMAFSSGFTPSGPDVAGGATLKCPATAGLAVACTDAAGTLKFFTGGTTQRARLEANGDFKLLNASAGGYFERARTVAMGEWIAVAFAAGTYTGNGAMTWTLTSPDQVSLRYMLVGHTMFLEWSIATSTVGGTPNIGLRIAIPGGFTTSTTALFRGTHSYSDNGGAQLIGTARLSTTGTDITLEKADESNWTASTNLTATTGAVWFEVN